LPEGRDLPPLPEFGFNLPVDPGKLPSVEVVDTAIEPGFTPFAHVFTPTFVRRNLYNLPVS
jgi:hypothetical protein